LGHIIVQELILVIWLLARRTNAHDTPTDSHTHLLSYSKLASLAIVFLRMPKSPFFDTHSTADFFLGNFRGKFGTQFSVDGFWGRPGGYLSTTVVRHFSTLSRDSRGHPAAGQPPGATELESVVMCQGGLIVSHFFLQTDPCDSLKQVLLAPTASPSSLSIHPGYGF
jgi:hypothetical protein